MGAADQFPIPERLHELIQDRLAGLPAGTLEALQVVSALSTPTLDAIASAMAPARSVDVRLRPALDQKVLEVEGRRVRFAHPLLASAVYQSIGDVPRRELHGKLAAVVNDPEERARHLALSVDGPDGAVSDGLEEAAMRAVARGAPQSAAQLWEMARGTTPRDRLEALGHRTHMAGIAHFESGNTSLARRLLQEAVELAVRGPQRARALLDLGMVVSAEEGWRQAVDVFTSALEEAGDELAL